MTNERRPHDNANNQKTTTTSAPPPHDLNAEGALLGAALLSAAALEVLATKVVPEDFYSPNHAKIAGGLIAAFEQGWKADPVTVGDYLARNGQGFDDMGSFMMRLLVDTPATSSADRYAAIVHDHATLRRIVQASHKASELALSRPFDVHEAVEQTREFFDAVASQNGSRAYSMLDMPDMAAILAGDNMRPEPTILTRADGQALFYAGKMHVLQAEPSSGKSWIALYAALEVLNMGGAVVFVDYEDSGGGITQRLVALGCDPAHIIERFQYVRPSGPMGTQEKAELMALFRRLNPDLVIIDGVAEAISRDGYDEDRNSEVVKWVDNYPRWISQTGACVVMIDHIAKDKERGGRYARGASHKLAAVDGASYQVKIIHSFSRSKGGRVKLVVAKDRPGVFTIGEVAAEVKIDPSGNGEAVRMTIERAIERQSSSDSWKPTKLMEKLSLELERASNPLSPRVLLDMTTGNGKRSSTHEALARLEADNFVVPFKVGNSTYLRLVKPYREGDAPLPVPQTTMADLWNQHEDELAKRRGGVSDDGDPGPIEPTD